MKFANKKLRLLVLVFILASMFVNNMPVLHTQASELGTPTFQLKKINKGTGVKIIIGKTLAAKRYQISITCDSKEFKEYKQTKWFVMLHEAFTQDAQEARQHDQVRPVLLQRFGQLLLESLLAAAELFRDLFSGNAGLLRAFQRIGVRPVADDQRHLTGCQDPFLFRVQNRLQIGPAARYENGDPRLP